MTLGLCQGNNLTVSRFIFCCSCGASFSGSCHWRRTLSPLKVWLLHARRRVVLRCSSAVSSAFGQMRKSGGAPAPPPAFLPRGAERQRGQKGGIAARAFAVAGEPKRRPPSDEARARALLVVTLRPRKAPSAACSNGGALTARPPATPCCRGPPPQAAASAFRFARSKRCSFWAGNPFCGSLDTSPPPVRARKNEMVGPRLMCLAAAGVPAGIDPVTA